MSVFIYAMGQSDRKFVLQPQIEVDLKVVRSERKPPPHE